MKTTQHTPGPYRVAYGAVWSGETSILLADRNEPKTSPVERDRNIDFAALACNAHYELLQACKAALPYVDACVVHQCDGAIEASKQIRMALQLANS